MWKKPWGYKEGFICGAGLLVTGLLLQSITGGIRWELFAWSINIIVLALYLFLLTAMHLLRKRVYAFEWLSHYTSAVSSLIYVAAITVLMGCIRQVPSTQSPVDLLGLSKMLSFWPFVLLYSWLASALGLTILRTSFPLKVRKIPFLLNHMGLFIVLLTTTFGSADLQRLRMITQIGKTEWRATDENGKLVELPLAIELKDFTIYEYPPKLMLIDNRTGQPLPMAASVATEDTLKYTEFHSMGATYAIYLTATNTNTGQTKRGWVSNGSFAFPYKALHLNGENSLVMPEREPQRFVSDVTVYTQEGSILQDTIEVNHPLKVAGWNIYQLSYDETKGRWSNISIFELVRDPWLPFVYTGIIMMVLGAICLFINAPKEKEVSSDEKQTEYKEEENI